MQIRDEFGLFLAGESETTRLEAIGNLMAANGTKAYGRELLLWRMFSSFLTKLELVRLAGSSFVDKRANGTWSVATFLLAEPDQDVVGNALNSLTFSLNRALGHRTLRFFNTSERPQRVLYCLARYAEESIDRKFSEILSSSMESQLSDAFLARSFNALFRLGMKDKRAIKVAVDLISSHIDATNMDRKAAVAAIVYLCFAGDHEDIENLKLIQNKVTIPELRRLLNWGLYELNGFEQLHFNLEAAKNFFKRAANLAEPNFTGYGCFSNEALIQGVKEFLKELEPEGYSSATRTILALGNAETIDLLAADQNIGIEAIRTKSMGDLKQLWKYFLPTHSKTFAIAARDPSLIDFWNERDPEVIYVCLSKEDFLPLATANTANRAPGKTQELSAIGVWQKEFEKCLTTEEQMTRAIDLLVSLFLILEKENISGSKSSEDCE